MGEDCIASVPAANTFHTFLTFPVSWTAREREETGRSTVLIGLVRQGGFASTTLVDATGVVVPTVENGPYFQEGGWDFEVESELYFDVPPPFEGQVRYEGPPGIGFVADFDFAENCLSFSEQPAQGGGGGNSPPSGESQYQHRPRSLGRTSAVLWKLFRP